MLATSLAKKIRFGQRKSQNRRPLTLPTQAINGQEIHLTDEPRDMRVVAWHRSTFTSGKALYLIRGETALARRDAENYTARPSAQRGQGVRPKHDQPRYRFSHFG
jgi:hypothetical protein